MTERQVSPEARVHRDLAAWYVAPGVWQAWAGQVPEAGLAIERAGRFIRRVVGTPG